MSVKTIWRGTQILCRGAGARGARSAAAGAARRRRRRRGVRQQLKTAFSEPAFWGQRRIHVRCQSIFVLMCCTHILAG